VCGSAGKKRKEGLFMRRILLIVAMLLIVAAPAFAAVTIGAKQTKFLGCRTVEVNYVCNAGEKIRAFALDVNVDSNFYISRIWDYNKGESNKSPNTRAGFGIFPGKFRDWIDPANPNWVDPNYTPVAPVADTDAAGTGIGTKRIIVEMGSLYVGDLNRPPSSGVLFKIDVDPNKFGISECNLNIGVNATRGGVVKEDGNTIVPTLPGLNTIKVSFPKCHPCWPPYDTQFTEWTSVLEPNCWCGTVSADNNATILWSVQCKGDNDGKGEGLSKYRVFSSDLTRFKASYGLRWTQLRNNPDGNATICADTDHRGEGLSKYRVFSSDLTKFKANYGLRITQMKPWCPTYP